MNSLEASDAAAAAVATAPRVTLADIEEAIAAEYTMTADKAVGVGTPIVAPLQVLTLCILVLKNGFTIVGKSAPASAENFNRELGRDFARQDAIRQIWPLMGFSLRDRLAGL